MAHSQETKNAVRNSYVTELLALSLAASTHGVPQGTAGRWKSDAKIEGDDWDLARAAGRRSAGEAGEHTIPFIEEFSEQIKETLTLIQSEEGKALTLDARIKAMTSLTDMYSKVMKLSGGNKKLNKRTVAAEVLKLLAKFIANHHPELASDFATILTHFAPQLDKELSN